jgi:hypothetical protein
MDDDTLFWCLAAFTFLLIAGIVWLNRRVFRRQPKAFAVLHRFEDVGGNSAANAVRHMREVIGLAVRLASGGVLVIRWMADWAGFGCWSLALQIPPNSGATNEEVLSAFWDGMNRHLTFDIESVDSNRVSYHRPRQIHKSKLSADAHPVAAAEEFLTQLFPLSHGVEISSHVRDAIIRAEKVSAFAERLAAKNIVIAKLDCNCLESGLLVVGFIQR